MSTVPDSLIATTSRPVSLQMRADLVVRQHRYQGETYFVVKEPIGQEYSYMREEDFTLLTSLDGKASLEHIKETFERAHAPLKISYRDLQHFLGSLHRSSLVVSSVPEQGTQLLERGRRVQRNKILGQLAYIFAIRTRGVDPDRFLNWLHPKAGWLFSRPMVVVSICLWLAALVLVGVQFDVFLSRLPTFQQFFGPSNWIYLGLTLAFVKIVHELGHGLTCKRFGGECHELGFMLLVFMPALYCNVSDSWLLSNKYKRIAIASAGIYIELTLAAIATFVWWFTVPGLVNYIALSTMFVCSVNTMMFNGNPLLRFDGYYILAHQMEIPNMRQKARDVLRRWVFQSCLGIEMPNDPYLPRQNRLFMAIYSVASVTYRWLVVLSILLFVNSALEPYGLQMVGRLIGLIGFFGLVVQPAWQLFQFFHLPGRLQDMKMRRVLISVAVVGAVAAAVLLVPLPHDLSCSAVTQLADVERVFVVQPGQIEAVMVKPGQRVEAGQEMLRLKNPELQLSVINLRRQRESLENRLRTLNRVQFGDQIAALEKLSLRAELRSVEQLLSRREEEHARLIIVSPRPGTVAQPIRRSPPDDGKNQLTSWSGYVLDPHNRGARLEEGTEVCQVGDTAQIEGILLIDQSDIEFVEIGQQVRLQLESAPGQILEGKIAEISEHQIDSVPTVLTVQGGGDVATRVDQSGDPVPLTTSYQARVSLESAPQSFVAGLRGRARVYTGYQTLGTRLWRGVMQAIRFQG